MNTTLKKTDRPKENEFNQFETTALQILIFYAMIYNMYKKSNIWLFNIK